MRTEKEIGAGVVAEQPAVKTNPLDKTRKPSFNYREDAFHIVPFLGMAITMAFSVIGTLGFGKILVYVLGLITKMLPRPFEAWIGEWILGVFEPIFPLTLLWLFFDVRYHVKIGPGSFSTMSIFGIQFLKMRMFGRWFAVVFFGETSCFKWNKVWKGDLGGTSITVEIKGAIKALDADGVLQPVYSKDGGDPKVEIFWAPLDPFKGVRRVDQGEKPNPGVIWSNTLSYAESVFKQAASKSTLTMEKVMGSQDLNRIFMEALLGVGDDDPNEDNKVRYSSYWMLVGTKCEWVYETDDGIILYNPRVTDMGEHPDLLKAQRDRGKLMIEARAKAAALDITAKAVKEAGPDAENAMILNGDLSGEEVKIQRVTVDIPGLTGEQKVQVAEAVGKAAPAVAAMLSGRGQQQDGRRRRPRRGDQRPSGDEKKGGEKK